MEEVEQLALSQEAFDRLYQEMEEAKSRNQEFDQ